MSRTLSRKALELDPRAYAARRPELRAQMIPVRRERRVQLGDMVVAEFENAETLQYQVQEMLFVELSGAGWTGEAAEQAAREELEAYSRMLPSSHELVATLFLELQDLSTVRSELARLEGIQRALSIELAGCEPVRGVELPGRDEPQDGDRPTVSVHVVRFRFDDAQRDAFRDPSVAAALVVDHPEYAADAPITGATRLSLLADLAL